MESIMDIAIVSGGSKGIGKAIKNILEKNILVIDLSRHSGFDLMDEEDLRKAEDLVKNARILINNIGGGGSWSNFEEQMSKNYGIMVRLTNSFLKGKGNRVITISSIYGKEKGHNPGFTASKAAQIAYMKSLAGKYKGVTFNTICPGHIDVGKPFPDKPKVIGKPEDVAYLVEFLCSDKANHVNGACITVDGGESSSF
jgi:3-oxoacyl-[acyl-carrier protein] reductase